MKIQKTYTAAFSLLLVASLFPSLHGQTILSGDHVIEGDLSVENNMTVDQSLVVNGNSGVVFRGVGPTVQGIFPSNDNITPGPGVALISDRNMFMWDPARAIIRFGWVSPAPEHAYWSTSWGYSTIAAGVLSTTWGQWTIAEALHSTAWGIMNVASGDYSTAWGYTTAAIGRASTAWGSGTDALGRYSTAWGLATYAESY